ncbi:MAG: hypothetical protein WCR67_04435 [Bacilli bacterium]
MINLNIEVKALRETVFEKKMFSIVSFQAVNKNKISRADAVGFRKVLSRILRNYEKLSYECLNIFSQYKPDSNEHLLNICALGHLRYLSGDKEEIANSYHDSFLIMRLSGNPSENAQRLIKASESKLVLSDDVSSLPYLHNSLLLETKEFILRDLALTFSDKDAIKISMALNRLPCFYYAVNTKVAKLEDYLNDPRFEAINLMDKNTILRHKRLGEKPLKDLKSGALYPVSYPEIFCYSQLDIPALTPMILMSANHNPANGLFLSFMVDDIYNSEVTVVYDDAISFRLATDYKERFGLKHLLPLFSQNKMIKTYRESNCYDVVISKGHDSHMGQSSSHPAILPSLTKEDLIKNRQLLLDDLKESSYFVKKGGNLVFYSGSLLKEETTDVKNAFLEKNPHYELVVSDFVRPDISQSDAGYYAIFRRIK